MYKFVATRTFEKNLKKLDEKTRFRIIRYIEKNLQNCDNPRLYGKCLKAEYSECWRYRVGNYRIIVKIIDDEFVILGLSVGHRGSIYKNLKI